MRILLAAIIGLGIGVYVSVFFIVGLGADIINEVMPYNPSDLVTTYSESPLDFSDGQAVTPNYNVQPAVGVRR